MSQSVCVFTELGSYTVDLLEWKDVANLLPEDRIIISDATVAGIAKSHGINVDITFPAGEASKNIEQYLQLLDRIADKHPSRKTTVVAVGGGVTGDLAGFAAATYMRGLPFIQVPTTLLAMVDSSVGGKVGIDLAAGKNLVGAFYSPKQVIIPIDALASLPPRQIAAGMAEVWKYAFIMSREFLDELDQLPVRSGTDIPARLVHRCVDFKRQVVENDYRETSGLRATLNFGHTIGHAIEKVLEYQELLHGEAISIGMYLETQLAERIGFAAPGLASEVGERLSRQGLPLTHPVLQSADLLVEAMRGDKKSTGRKLAFSLIPELGACRLVPDVAESDVRSVLQ
jgi:3-dehydroquinate synthase